MSAAKSELVDCRHGLVAQRRELKAELTKLAQGIAALDKVLLMLDPNYKPEAGYANRRGTAGGSPFSHGETTTLALAALRDIGRPATATECAQAMLTSKGVPADEAVQERIASRVVALFAHKADAGQVRRVGTNGGRHVLWEIAR